METAMLKVPSSPSRPYRPNNKGTSSTQNGPATHMKAESSRIYAPLAHPSPFYIPSLLLW